MILHYVDIVAEVHICIYVFLYILNSVEMDVAVYCTWFGKIVTPHSPHWGALLRLILPTHSPSDLSSY